MISKYNFKELVCDVGVRHVVKKQKPRMVNGRYVVGGDDSHEVLLQNKKNISMSSNMNDIDSSKYIDQISILKKTNNKLIADNGKLGVEISNLKADIKKILSDKIVTDGTIKDDIEILIKSLFKDFLNREVVFSNFFEVAIADFVKNINESIKYKIVVSSNDYDIIKALVPNGVDVEVSSELLHGDFYVHHNEIIKEINYSEYVTRIIDSIKL